MNIINISRDIQSQAAITDRHAHEKEGNERREGGTAGTPYPAPKKRKAKKASKKKVQGNVRGVSAATRNPDGV